MPPQVGDFVRFSSPHALPQTTAYLAKNDTGSDIVAGALVYRGGWHNEATPGGMRGPSVFLASNDASPGADGVALAAVADGAWGWFAALHECVVAGLNTSGAAIGDPVYLGEDGACTLTKPSATGTRAQQVGNVTLLHATAGRVAFDCLALRNLVSPPDGVTVQRAKVTLTNAEVKALRATPKTLVSAPGAGYALCFMGAYFELNYGGAAWSIAGAGDDLKVKYTDGSGVAASDTVDSSSFIDATADFVTNARPSADLKGAASAINNKPLVLHNIGGAEFGGGHADSTITVTVLYTVLTSSL